MKRIILALSFMGAQAHGASVDVTTYVSQVTVYPQGAKVLRRGSIVMQAGSASLVFPGLPAEAVEDSIRLLAEGPKGSKLFGVRFAEAFSPEAALKQRRDLEAKIRSLDDEKTALNDGIGARQIEMDILKALATQGASQAGTARVGVAGMATEVAAVGKRFNALLAATRKDKQSLRSLQERLDALNRELANLGGEERAQRSAEADVELAEAGTLSFTLSYQVQSASWTPVYDIRLEGSKVALSFSGDIRQQSGEDWGNVKLELSTARPAAFTEIPDPTQWWLDYNAPRPLYNNALRKNSRSGVMAPAMTRAPEADAMSAAPVAEAAPVQQEMAETVASEFAISFEVKREMTVPSDSTAHRVSVAESSHPAELQLVAVPRLEQTAFIQATVKYEGQQPLLAGQASLFREGEFVGKAGLTAVAPGETFKLGFGKDDQIKIKRKLVSEKSSPGKGFLFSPGRRRYHWETTLNNFHGSARSLELREQLPRSRQKEIIVEGLDMSPKPAPEDASQPGLLIWRIDLKPKQEQKVMFRYEIRFPEGQAVSGME